MTDLTGAGPTTAHGHGVGLAVQFAHGGADPTVPAGVSIATGTPGGHMDTPALGLTSGPMDTLPPVPMDTPTAMDTPKDTAMDTLRGALMGTPARLGTDTPVDTQVTGVSVSTRLPVTKAGRRRFLIAGTRRTVTVGHVSVPVSVSPAATGTTPAAGGHTGTGHTGTGTGEKSAYEAGGHGKIYRALLTVIVSVVASLGQVRFARDHDFVNEVVVGHFDVTPWLAVAVFDLVVAAFLYAGREVFPKGFTPWPFWLSSMILAGLSIYTNTQHKGAWITAPASGVLFMLWFLMFFYEYLGWRRDEGELGARVPNLLLSKLAISERKVARKGWNLATSRPMARALAHRKEQGDKEMTIRDVVIYAARLWLDVYADQLYVHLNPEGGKKVRRWHLARRRLALSRAEMTARDAVDMWMGLPVIERDGIKASRISYAAPVDEPPRAAGRPADDPPVEQWAAEDRVQHREPPRPPRDRSARYDRSPEVPVPVSPAPAGAETMPVFQDEWFATHADKIAWVKEHVRDWATRPAPLSVRELKAIALEAPHHVRLGNSGTQRQVAVCLRVDRIRARERDRHNGEVVR